MKTAVEYLIEQLQAPCKGVPSHIMAEALRLEKQQLDLWIYPPIYPEFIKGKNYSENVLAETGQHTDLQVMCWIYVEGDEGGYAWANCYQQLDGDAQFDDQYTVIKWQPIPKV